MSTYAGKSFMSVFNAFYYLWSSLVASYIGNNPLLKKRVKILTSPLVWSLAVSQEVFNVLNFNSEFAVVIAGLTASALLGLIYGAPIVLVLKYTLLKHRKIRHKSRVLTLSLMTLVASSCLVEVAEIAMIDSLMMASTVMLMLSTIFAMSIAGPLMMITISKRLMASLHH